MRCEDGSSFFFADEFDEFAGISCGVCFVHCIGSFCRVENKEGCEDTDKDKSGLHKCCGDINEGYH